MQLMENFIIDDQHDARGKIKCAVYENIVRYGVKLRKCMRTVKC